MPIHVELVTQERKLFEELNADMVILPGIEGEMGILPHHAPLLTTLAVGEMVVRKGNAEERFAIYGGVVDIRPDKVIVLADAAESNYALDAEKIEQARKSALERLANPANTDQAAAMADLRRADLSLKVSRKLQTGGSKMRILADDES